MVNLKCSSLVRITNPTSFQVAKIQSTSHLIVQRRTKASTATQCETIKHVEQLTATADIIKKSKQTNVVLPSSSKQSQSSSDQSTINLTFSNSKECFKSKTTLELVRAVIVLKLCSYPLLVNNHQKLIKFGQTVLGRRLFRTLMKATFYGHFVAGEDEKEISVKINHLASFGVKSILDYSAEDEVTGECKDEGSSQNEGQPVIADENVKDDLKKFVIENQFTDPVKYHVTARTYFYLSEAQCEKNMEIFHKCIDAVAGITNQTGFAAIKLTALCRPQLLLKLSKAITETREAFKESFVNLPLIETINSGKDSLPNRDHHPLISGLDKDQLMMINLLSWNEIIDTEDIFQHLRRTSASPDSKWSFRSTFSAEEEEMFCNMVRRIDAIAQHAQASGVRIMIDAEQTYLQPAINRLTIELMKKYNKKETIVFNTYQCYLRSAFDTMLLDLNLAYMNDFYFGAKLVRGAYMEQERLRSAEFGYEDPINDDFDKTSEMYHKTLDYLMRQIARNDLDSKRIAIMVATHNEDTVRFAVENMERLGIRPDHKVICFGQLYAMSDHISFSLGQSGYSVYKYVPYGPIDEVLPYLSRRAVENSSLIGKSLRERVLIRQEIVRRLISGEWFHSPKGNYQPV